MKKNRILFLALLFCLLPLAGCYKVALSDIEPGKVYIKAFKNQTFYREFDEYFNSALVRELTTMGTLTPVSSPEQADYILSGTIKSVFKNIIRTGKDDLPMEYQYSCVIEYSFASVEGTSDKGELTLRRSWRYLPPYGESEESSLKKLSEFLSEELARKITTKW